MLKKTLKELKKIIGTELTLSEMENEVQEILNIEDQDKNSIFDGETGGYIENGEYSYTTWKNSKKDETVDINVCFEVIEDNEDIFEILVKITGIEEL